MKKKKNVLSMSNREAKESIVIK